ncbi:MAG: hypothetical protein AAGI30_02280 [Planctomycetota bacterium]
MNTPPETSASNQTPSLTQLRVVVGALVGGQVMFLAVVIVLLAAVQPGGFVPGSTMALVLGVAVIGVAIGTTVAQVVIRGGVIASVRAAVEQAANPDEAVSRVGQAFTGLTIIRAAMFEGWGLFGVVSLMLTGQWVFVLAPLASVVGIASVFPTRDRFGAFLDRVLGDGDEMSMPERG